MWAEGMRWNFCESVLEWWNEFQVAGEVRMIQISAYEDA